MQALDNAFNGSQSRDALAILDREETNYRTAVQWAVADGRLPVAADLGDTFRMYLERSGCLRERDAWVTWLREAVTKQGFTKEAAGYERQHAYTRFVQGDPQGAAKQLEDLISRLRGTTEFDAAFQLASAIRDLGRILVECGATAQAVPVLRESIQLWETLVEKAGGQPWEELLVSVDRAKSATELRNLAATMGDLANALRNSGQLDEALDVVEQSIGIQEAMGNQRDVATGNGQCAQILMAAGRYDEADARYDIALEAARRAGDSELEGALLQHQGNLARNRGQLDRASALYQQALRLFQEQGHQPAIMRTYNLLGVVERNRGRLSDARAWYQKSRELAAKLRDQPGLGQAAQNIGIVCQLEGDAARERHDEPAARRHYDAARRSVEESLQINRALASQPDVALALGQLAIIHLRLGDLDSAERHAHEAREIRESLNLLEAEREYDTLFQVARGRGDAAAAEEWAAKRDALRQEAERRAGGRGGLPTEMLKSLKILTLTCAHAGFGDGKLGADHEEALARLDEAPAPFCDLAAFLRQLAGGELPPVPHGLPAELADSLEKMIKDIRDASH
jgi:tetratricopeptide (TPR) repeat protein